MNSPFSIDSPLYHFTTRVFDVICLNLLFLLCCIPLVTIGPSVTALYYCMLKINRHDDDSISSMFFHSFKTNLKQGILLTLFFIAGAIFLIMDIHVCSTLDVDLLKYIRIILYILCVVLVMIASYAFPLLAQFQNSNMQLLKNALLMSIWNIGCAPIIVILNAIPWVLLFLLPGLFTRTLMVWLTFGFAGIAWLNSKLFVKIFNKFITETQE